VSKWIEGVDYRDAIGGYWTIGEHRVQTLIRGKFIDSEYGDITLYPSGIIVIRNVFFWDGASGPAIDTDTNMKGSCVHDALYKLLKSNKLKNSYLNRRRVDKTFYKICRDDGMNWVRANYFYYAVRACGWNHV